MAYTREQLENKTLKQLEAISHSEFEGPKRFKDKPTAVARILTMQDPRPKFLKDKDEAPPLTEDNPKPEPKPGKGEKPAKPETKERKKRGFYFQLPPEPEQKNVRDGTNRAKLVELMSRPEGATFDELYEATWGSKKGMTPAVARKTTYEGIRLLHYYVGYGIDHDLETGKLRLTTEKTKK